MSEFNKKREGFTKIYQDYIEKIYRFVYLKVNTRDSAEDITSKVFLKCWEAYKDTKIDNMNAFLYRTANNAVIDYYRENSKKNIISSEYMASFADMKPSAFDRSAVSAEVERIKLALNEIKKEYQDIIIWHYLEDMTIKEIAELTGKTEGNVRVMAHRGLAALRKILS